MVAALTPTCPNCRAFASRRLDELCLMMKVDYFRCGQCQHVWTVDRATHDILMHLTPLSAPSAQG